MAQVFAELLDYTYANDLCLSYWHTQILILDSIYHFYIYKVLKLFYKIQYFENICKVSKHCKMGEYRIWFFFLIYNQHTRIQSLSICPESVWFKFFSVSCWLTLCIGGFHLVIFHIELNRVQLQNASSNMLHKNEQMIQNCTRLPSSTRPIHTVNI